MSHPRSLAVIPARGGSKRLPRKNILPFHGKPILIWTLEAAQKSNCFERIICSTEDDEIAEIVRHYGFETDKRPEHLATDRATVNQVTLDLIDRLEKENDCYDNVAMLYATAPMRNSEDIRNTMKLLEEEDTFFAMAVTHFIYSPYQALSKEKDDVLTYSFPLISKMKSQDLPEAYADNGSIYAAKIKKMKEVGFAHAKTKGYIMPFVRSVDIDTQEDYELAMYLAEKYLLR